MAQFELNIYGADDEIIKTFATDKIRWGVFMQAQELAEKAEKMQPADQIKAISDFMKKIFPTITAADLEGADADDVINTFKQLINKAQRIEGAPAEDAAKNPAGEA